MARVTIEDCLDKISNRFTLVVVVAKRMRQLLKGDQPLVEANNKFVVTALREVEAGKLTTNMSKEEMALKIEKALKKQPLLENNDEEATEE